MANIIRSLTRKQLTNRNISTLSHNNPLFSSGSSLDPNLPSGFGLFGNGVGLSPGNEGFRVNEKVPHLKRLVFGPFFSSGSFLDPNLTSGFGLFGNGVELSHSNEGCRVNEQVTHLKRLVFSSGSLMDPNLTSGFGLSHEESKFDNGVGFGLNPSNEGLRVKEEVYHLKRCGLYPFLSSGSFLDPGLTYGLGLCQVIGLCGDGVEDPGMMWADSVKKKRKKKMNKHKYKKLRKRLRRKTKT